MVIAMQLLSFLWYSPYLFGFKWIVYADFSLSSIPRSDTFVFYKPFLLSIISTAVLYYALVLVFIKLSVNTLLRGVSYAVFCWFVFLFMVTLMHHSFAQRPIGLTLIDMGRDLLMFIIGGLCIAAWNRRQQRKEESNG